MNLVPDYREQSIIVAVVVGWLRGFLSEGGGCVHGRRRGLVWTRSGQVDEGLGVHLVGSPGQRRPRRNIFSSAAMDP